MPTCECGAVRKFGKSCWACGSTEQAQVEKIQISRKTIAELKREAEKELNYGTTQ